MVYQIANIARDVRIAIDENRNSDSLVGIKDIDALSLDEIIHSKIEDAVTRIHSDAPVYLLECGHNFGESIHWGDMGSGRVLLPDDFMRLVVFRMSDWECPVYEAISPNSPQNLLQHSRFKGLRGTPQCPVCVLSVRPEGKVLEFYSCKNEDATVSEGVYIPFSKIDSDGGIDISERCYRSTIYLTAALVATAYGDADKVSMFTELSKSMLR